MDRTLFTPAMVETFRVCKRAYEQAFLKANSRPGGQKLSSLCKRFLLKAIAELNRDRLKTVNEAQRFIGQHWSALKIENNQTESIQNRSVQAFRFAYKALVSYVNNPYRPKGTEIVAVNTVMRARVPHAQVYLEDVFDLILYHKDEGLLEIVDYHLNPLKAFDPAWPAAAILIKQFLCEKLRTRLPFKRIRITFIQLRSQGPLIKSIDLDESVYRLHWPSVVESLNQMKSAREFPPHQSEICNRCELLSACMQSGTFAENGFGRNAESGKDLICRSA